ncbi:MAG: protein kinase [Deltaproteobacteria bacterium]|nr:protein kinase [Deltaproteobacteria bacterium]
MNSASATLKSAQVIAERYVILRLLREEPWGGVYLAQDRLLKVEVGLKFISREVPDFEASRGFLIKEAALAYRLRHPLILTVFHGSENREGFYLVQEPYGGESLLARLNRLERFTLPQALHLLDEVGRAVAFAHEHGVVHQSLNPLNILMEGDRIKLANFACPPSLEEQVGLLELRAYNAPEVVRGEGVTTRANVFSLGVLGFRLTVGSLPYPLTFDEAFPYRLETPLADLEEVPVPLQNFLLGCLAVEPGDRYPDIISFLAALEQSRDLLRGAFREKSFLWQPKPGVSLGDAAKTAAAKLWEKSKIVSRQLWQETKTRSRHLWEKLKPAAAQALDKIKAAPPRFFWGLGLALLTIMVLWSGAKLLKRGASSSQPPVATGPSTLPETVGPPRTAGSTPSNPVIIERGAPAAPRPSHTSQPRPRAVSKPPASGAQYIIPVASYTQLKQALALQNRLKAQNLPAKAVRTSPGGKAVFQVQVGPLTGKQAAQEAARRIKELEGISAKVVEVSSATSSPSTTLRRRP